MKLILGIIPIVIASSVARPEIGFDTSRLINSPVIVHDSAQLPATILYETGAKRLFSSSRDLQLINLSEYIDRREPKSRQSYLEEDLVPVKLIYESEGDEIEALVEEKSLGSLKKEPQGKLLLNRVQRSDTSNLMKSLFGRTAEDEIIQNIRQNRGVMHKVDDKGVLPVDADDLNKGLGIQARNDRPDVHDSNPPPSLGDFSIDYSLNKVNDVINNVDYDRNNAITRRGQHYQTKMRFQPPISAASAPLSLNYYKHYEMQPLIKVVSYYPIPLEAVTKDRSGTVVKNFPHGNMWSALTNTIKFSKSETRRKRDTNDDDNLEIPQSILEDLSRHHSRLNLMRTPSLKLKVHRGGIAIAGPGGIATAGSGGTTIVGPGGTALTPPDATAIVGPGGRVIHLSPDFDVSKIKARSSSSGGISLSQLIKEHGKVVAHGPIVLYSPPSNQYDQLDYASLIENS